MTDRFYEAVYSEKLSQERGDIRFIIIDQDTGEILDDANGWGYRSARNAYRRFGYTQSSFQKDKKKAGSAKTARAKPASVRGISRNFNKFIFL